MRDSTRTILLNLLGAGIGLGITFLFMSFHIEPMWYLALLAGLAYFLFWMIMRSAENEEEKQRRFDSMNVCHYCNLFKEGVKTCSNDHHRFKHCLDCCNKLGVEIDIDQI